MAGPADRPALLPCAIVPVNTGGVDRFKPGLLAISPNDHMLAIVDHAPADGRAPVEIFESGAILPRDAREESQYGIHRDTNATRVCSACSTARIASWPWFLVHERVGQKLEVFPDPRARYERTKKLLFARAAQSTKPR